MALVQCVECGASISDKAKNCPKCGCTEPFKIEELNTCPECSAEILLSSVSCPECGYPEPFSSRRDPSITSPLQQVTNYNEIGDQRINNEKKNNETQNTTAIVKEGLLDTQTDPESDNSESFISRQDSLAIHPPQQVTNNSERIYDKRIECHVETPNKLAEEKSYTSEYDKEVRINAANIITSSELHCPKCCRESRFIGLDDTKRSSWGCVLKDLFVYLFGFAFLGVFIYFTYLEAIKNAIYLTLLIAGLILGLIIGFFRVLWYFITTTKKERRLRKKMQIFVGRAMDKVETHPSNLPFFNRAIDIMCPYCGYKIESVSYREFDPVRKNVRL